MNTVEHRAYWLALAHLPGWDTGRVNRLMLEITAGRKLTLGEFFEMEPEEWQDAFGLSSGECSSLVEARSALAELSTAAEDLLMQAIDIIPILSADYPKVLKKNLTLEGSPPLLYTKGNKRLLHESTVAVVGSANASDAALQFSEAVAKRCSEERRVVVSGLGRGVDRAAFDSTLNHHGRSIIVLQQGIRTFESGFRQYESRIAEGEMLIVSPFSPKTSWSSSLAAARSPYIHGLAEEIYVAECDPDDDIFADIMHALKKGRRVYVRSAEPDEESAGDLLIWGGAMPVDSEGNVLPRRPMVPRAPLKQLSFGRQEEDFESKLKAYLIDVSRPVSAKEIKQELKLVLETKELSRLLKALEFIEATKTKGGALQFKMKSGRHSLRRLSHKSPDHLGVLP